MNADEAEKGHPKADSAAGPKIPGPEASGQGADIPGSGKGVGIGAGTEPNTFEPEEDPDATEDNAGS
ncbi:hypothetical protein [Arthrobacter oryzae]|uniref:hypothetical protein n=1 Tax=Arthrobacter oryzae TaxID=409290 RepID=UPI0030C9AC19